MLQGCTAVTTMNFRTFSLPRSNCTHYHQTITNLLSISKDLLIVDISYKIKRCVCVCAFVCVIDFFHLTQCFQSSSILQCVSVPHPFLVPSNISLNGYTTFLSHLYQVTITKGTLLDEYDQKQAGSNHGGHEVKNLNNRELIMQNETATLGASLAVSYKTKHTLTIWSGSCAPQYLHK